MEMVFCPSCRGTKHVNGLGGIVKDCLFCNVTGKVTRDRLPEPVELDVPSDTMKIVHQVGKDFPAQIEDGKGSKRKVFKR